MASGSPPPSLKSVLIYVRYKKIAGYFCFVCLFTPVFQPKPENAITIAVSSRVLFNMEKEQQIYEQQGMEEYIQHQVEHETQPFCPGPAFSFVKVRVLSMRTRWRNKAGSSPIGGSPYIGVGGGGLCGGTIHE